MSQRILAVDDDLSVTASLSLLCKQAGYACEVASSPDEALQRLDGGAFDLVLQDMNFSRQTTGEEGLELLEQIVERRPGLPVILITAWGSIELAVRGVKAGAVDFVAKPWNNEHLLQAMGTALTLAAGPPTDTAPNREDLDGRHDFGDIIGRDAKLLQVLEITGRVSGTDAPVLITGESGTGKDLVADAIHRNSPRAAGPFVKVNLGGISTTLFESEMFGHVKGAFTDASSDRTGRFELAHGGTIFLDEIGDLDLACQVKLLRVLQDRSFEILGSSTTRTVDIRVVSATNRNLMQMVEAGAFREDLLYRLNLIALHLPALRQRLDDIPLLAALFVRRTGQAYKRENLSITPAALGWLQTRPWPGNIRELQQVIERAVLMSQDDALTVAEFERCLEMHPEAGRAARLPTPGSMTIDEMERAMIQESLQAYNGNLSRTAEALGLSRAALYRRLAKHGIQP